MSLEVAQEQVTWTQRDRSVAIRRVSLTPCVKVRLSNIASVRSAQPLVTALSPERWKLLLRHVFHKLKLGRRQRRRVVVFGVMFQECSQVLHISDANSRHAVAYSLPKPAPFVADIDSSLCSLVRLERSGGQEGVRRLSWPMITLRLTEGIDTVREASEAGF